MKETTYRRKGNFKGFLFVFGLITELFPNSANAWDSLAEGYLEAGDKEKAKAYYEKAISLDKDGTVTENAKKMLKSMGF